jgi:hypothetical protein
MPPPPRPFACPDPIVVSELILLGSAGTGAVWGWLLARRSPGGRRPVAAALLLAAATLSIAAGIAALVGTGAAGGAATAFFAAAAAALLLHRAWLRSLSRRPRNSSTTHPHHG